MYRRFGKRLFDLLFVLPALILLVPFFLITGLLVLVAHGPPIFFRQVRPGRYSNSFVIYKFRTMSEASDRDGHPLSDKLRLTALGRFLRATSLDELPELFNIVKGEMSLVGPRPLLTEYLPRYTPEQTRRHEVLPGLTGWAQVSGRNAVTWGEKFDLDGWYVDNLSLWIDLKILWRTVWVVLRRQGISEPGHATASEFLGPMLAVEQPGPGDADQS